MLLGSIRTGRKTPKTPGSIREEEEITLIGISNLTADPTRTATLIRPQRIHHENVMQLNPQSQMPKRIAGSGFISGGAVTGRDTEGTATVNG